MTLPPDAFAVGPAPALAHEPYIRTVTGRRIYVRHPDLNPEIHLTDIAHALARISRYTGHTSHRYSVASHCLMVAELCPPEWRAAGLMHDAIEAILGDVSSPLKSLLPDYKALQDTWERGMAPRWGVATGHVRAVKDADRVAYAIERRDLCPYDPADAGRWDIEARGAIRVPLTAPRCLKFVGRPRSVAAWWLSEARRMNIPEVA